MIKVRDDRDQINVAKVYRANQGHIFQFWEELGRPEREELLAQIERIDFQLLQQLIDQIHTHNSHHGTLIPTFRPPQVIPAEPQTEVERSRHEHARAVGEEAIRDGRTAVFTVAGGQASRLGCDGPKGGFPIGPVTGACIFAIMADKISATSKRYRTSIPWYILVSRQNRQQTEALFQAHDYFGLSRADVYFLVQGELPAVNPRGRMLLEAPHRLAMAPNGHGGAVAALYQSGALQNMERRGIDILSYLQVDNPLAVVVDPVFVGHFLLADSEMGTKVVFKEEPEERVGVVATVDGVLKVVEYNELSPELLNTRDEEGRLAFRAGNTAMHLFDRNFLDQLNQDATALPYHQARKKVPRVDRKGEVKVPKTPNAIKFECFIFDVMPHAQSPITLEVRREAEFAPLKSQEGPTSPAAVKAAISHCHALWLEQAGVAVPRTPTGEVDMQLEIRPSTALDAAELKKSLDPDLKLEPGQDLVL